MNNLIAKRTGTKAYVLMFNRDLNEFDNYKNIKICLDKPITEILEKNKTFKEEILPTINQRSKEVTKKRRSYLDKTQKQVEKLVVGSVVYAIDKTKQSKWDATYEGPFTIVDQNRGGAYTLKDKTGEILKRRFTIDMLKPVTQEGGDNDVEKQNQEQHYKVEKILKDKKVRGKQLYWVKWKDYSNRYNTWEPEDHFDDVHVIRAYWKDKSKKTNKTS